MPVGIVLFVTFSLGYAYVTSNHILQEQIKENNSRILRDRINYIQNSAQQLLTLGDRGNVQKLISSFASQPDIDLLFVADKSGAIIASIHFNEIDKHWSDTKHTIDLKLIREVTNGNKSIIQQNLNHLNGLARICHNINNALRTVNCGFVYYQINLDYHFKQARKNILATLKYASIGIILGAILLFIALTVFLTKRTNNIVEALGLFASGERNIHLDVKGHDELSSISTSINKMLTVIRENEAAIQDKAERLRALIQTVVDAVITINSNGIIESFNPSAERIFGYKNSEVVGKNVNLLMPEPDHSLHDTYLANYLSTGIKKIIGIGREVEAKRKDGTIFPIELAISEMHIAGESVFTGIIRDITNRKLIEASLIAKTDELEKANQQLEKYAVTDALTGLYNRRHFDKSVADETRRALREHTPLSLLLIDIDYFKLLNDTLGHQVGDERLTDVANTLRTTFSRSGDIVHRYGGEEFAVLLPNTNQQQAHACAERLLRAIWEGNFSHPASKIADRLTISIGISTYVPHGTDKIPPETTRLIELADEALYEAKHAGRNQYKARIL